MNNSITENNKKRYLPHDINTRICIVATFAAIQEGYYIEQKM